MTQPDPFGVDFWIGPNASGQMDFDTTMRTVTGRDLLSQSLLCRQTTPTGSVIDNPQDCFDVRDWVSEGMTQAQLAALSQTITNELLKDQRVLDVQVKVAFNFATSRLDITEAFQSSYGPFTLTLSVSNVTVQLLNANLPAGP
jgi:hypothetical protein